MTYDALLIALCLHGRRPDAFGELVRQYEARLYRALFRVLRDAEEARDAVQDALLYAYRALGRFRGRADFYTWLYRIGVNRAITCRRQRRKACSLSGTADGRAVDLVDGSRASEPSYPVTCAEQHTAVWGALGRLSANDRALLVMKDVDGLKYEQLAELFSVPVGTIRSRLHRARLELRGLLEMAEG